MTAPTARSRRTRVRQLRIGFAAVRRDAFKGGAEAAAGRAHAHLEADGERLGYELVAADRLVRDADDARRAAAWAKDAGLDHLMVLHATFATGDLLAPLLSAAPAVGVWALPEAEGLPERRPGGTPDPLPLNSLCGLTMTMSALAHSAVGDPPGVKWFLGAPGDRAFDARWETTVRALHGLAAVRGARVLVVGGPAPAFYRFDERPGVADVRVENVPLERLYERMAAMTADEAERVTRAWLADEGPLEAPEEALLVASRVEWALHALAEDAGASAVALRCWPELPERCGAMACAAVGRLADDGLPTACEGDTMGALSMLALQAVADAPAALLDLSDVDADGDRVLLWHCGNAPRAMAAGGSTRLTTHFNRDGVGVVRDMVLAPGPATAFRLLGGGRRALVASGVVTDPSGTSYDGVRGWWGDLRWDGVPRSAAGFVAGLLDERLPHHLALARGAWTEALHELTVRLGGTVLAPGRVRDALVERSAVRS